MCLYNIILVWVFNIRELVCVISIEIGLWAGRSGILIPVQARDFYLL